MARFKLNEDELRILKRILELDDVRVWALDSFDDETLSEDEFSVFNSLREMVDLEELDPYEEEED